MRRLFRESVTLKRAGAVDEYGETLSSASEIVWARWSDRVTLVRDAMGREVVSGATVSTIEALAAGDVLVDPVGRDRTVLVVRRAQTVRGAASHYVASVS